MAFSIKQLEVVQFGDIKEIPTITPELSLRLQAIELSNGNREEAVKILASAFPQNEAKVLEYLKSPLTPTMELQRLQAYLLGGETGINKYDTIFDAAVEKAMGRNA